MYMHRAYRPTTYPAFLVNPLNARYNPEFNAHQCCIQWERGGAGVIHHLI